jgi:hypothetical protein
MRLVCGRSIKRSGHVNRNASRLQRRTLKFSNGSRLWGGVTKDPVKSIETIPSSGSQNLH